jgi:uncharacterized protein
MISRNFTAPKRESFFVFGPRGVGKTSYLRAHFPEALYVDLLEDETFNQLNASTQRLEGFVAGAKQHDVIIDEVQKIPRILDEVHRLIEQRAARFILTGSSARKLKRGGVNLLAGRAETRFMYPLTARELGNRFDLEQALISGMLPQAYLSSTSKRFLASYITTYLKEEIQQEGLTRNLGAFSRFLEAASFSQAQVLNISDVARQAAIERKVVEGYFTVLEDLLLGVRLPVFDKRASRDMTAHPKFFFFDAGVYRAIRPKGPLDRPEEIDGAALETLLFQELRALIEYFELDLKLFFWRTRAKLEVDLVAYGELGIFAFEIKRTARLKSEDFAGLRAFGEAYPEARRILLYGGARRLVQSGIDVIPVEEGLSGLLDILRQ